MFGILLSVRFKAAAQIHSSVPFLLCRFRLPLFPCSIRIFATISAPGGNLSSAYTLAGSALATATKLISFQHKFSLINYCIKMIINLICLPDRGERLGTSTQTHRQTVQFVQLSLAGRGHIFTNGRIGTLVIYNHFNDYCCVR